MTWSAQSLSVQDRFVRSCGQNGGHSAFAAFDRTSRDERWCAWQIAPTASASAASDRNAATPGSSRCTMTATCCFSAPPVPTTAILIVLAAYSLTGGDTGQRRRQQGDPPRIAQLQTRRTVPVEVGFLHRGLRRSVQRKQIHQRVVQHFQTPRDRVRALGGDHAIGNVSKAIAVNLDQSPAGETQSRVYPQQPDHKRIAILEGVFMLRPHPGTRRSRNMP